MASNLVPVSNFHPSAPKSPWIIKSNGCSRRDPRGSVISFSKPQIDQFRPPVSTLQMHWDPFGIYRYTSSHYVCIVCLSIINPFSFRTWTSTRIEWISRALNKLEYLLFYTITTGCCSLLLTLADRQQVAVITPTAAVMAWHSQQSKSQPFINRRTAVFR